jgi:hypothetical protein
MFTLSDGLGKVLNILTGTRREVECRFVRKRDDDGTVEHGDDVAVSGYALTNDQRDWAEELRMNAALELNMDDGRSFSIDLTEANGAFTGSGRTGRNTTWRYFPIPRDAPEPHSVGVTNSATGRLLAIGAGPDDAASLCDAWKRQLRQRGPAWLINSIASSYVTAYVADHGHWPEPDLTHVWRCPECRIPIDEHEAGECMDRWVDRTRGHDVNVAAGERATPYSTDIGAANELAAERIWPRGWAAINRRRAPVMIGKHVDGEGLQRRYSPITEAPTFALAVARGLIKAQPGGRDELEVQVPLSE